MQNKRKVTLSPSVMCADLVNLEKSIRELESTGIEKLHIDLIDGLFSPSMPLGIDTIKRMREITRMDFDVHIMSNHNDFFINEMIAIGVQQISFHIESSIHIDRYINLIKKHGIRAGVALNPATPLTTIEYILPQCDSVVLMLINPGFATDKGEKQVCYAHQKVADLSQLIQLKKLEVGIQVDGRVSLQSIPSLIKAGATNLVLGSTSLFIPGKSIKENKKSVDQSIQIGLKEGNSYVNQSLL